MIKSPCSVTGILFSNSLVRSKCKHAFLPSAHLMLDRIPVRGVWTLSKLIDVEDLKVSHKSINLRLGLERFDYAGALNVCARDGDLRNGMIIHGLVLVSGLVRRAFLTNSLIDMYSKCGKVDEARFVFDNAVELDDSSWNLLLSAYVRIGWLDVATDILVWMHRNGVKLNSAALGCVLNAIRMGFDDPKESQRLLHGCVVKIGLDLGFFVGSAMHCIFAENGGLDEALQVFDCLQNSNLVVFNAVIGGFSQFGTETCRGNQVEALRLFVEMMRRRMRPSRLTLKSVLESSISNREFKFGKQIHAHVIKNNLEEDEVIGSALIMLYSGSGWVEESLKCFESTPKTDIVSWGSMIQGYIQSGQLERAMNLFRKFLRIGRKPDEAIISSLMVGSGDSGTVRSGEQIHCYAVKDGLDRCTICSNSQMFFYSNIGDMDASIEIFQKTATIDVSSWSLLILNHALHGFAREALLLFEKMEEFKVSPKQSTFLAVLTACSNGGLMDEGFRYLDSMEMEHGLLPTRKHCACILDLLGRAGRLAEAEDFILTSPYKNDPALWSALLHSCQFHGDTEWSIRVGEKLMELDPLSSASYMTLYNVYSHMGKMSSAMRVRGRMRARGAIKDTDVSWIEIGVSVHSFMAGDNSHPQNSVIFAKLEEMLFKLKNRDSANGKSLMFFECQGKKRKDSSLMNSHGEMLAVALGVICLPESVPIRVMKNMRVCGDCHTTLKLLSQSERRKIIVRDDTRFHHFSGGSCSCGDYCW